VAQGGAVTGLSVRLTSTAVGAGLVSYVITFRTSAWGVLYTVRFRAGAQGAPAGTGGGAVPGTITLRAPAGTVFPDCFGGLQGCFPTYLVNGQASPSGAGSEDGNANLVTVAVPGLVTAGQLVVVSIYAVTNAAAPGAHALEVWTSSDTVAARASLTPSRPGAVGAPTLSLSTPAAGASAVYYTVRFRTGANGALAPGFSPSHVRTGAPAQSVTVVAPAGTVFANCFSFEDSCYPNYLIDGQRVGAGDGTVAGNGSVLSLALPTAANAGQALTITIDGAANAFSTGAHTLAISTSSNPVPVLVPFTLSRPASVSNPSLSVSSPAAGASGVMYHLAFTTSKAVPCLLHTVPARRIFSTRPPPSRFFCRHRRALRSPPA
jgi:hypothetical protein